MFGVDAGLLSVSWTLSRASRAFSNCIGVNVPFDMSAGIEGLCECLRSAGMDAPVSQLAHTA